MSVDPCTGLAQDLAAVGRWNTEACCSSKDTASRLNSPRNSKSSGTPHVSPGPKSQLCFGAEVDMEDDISSHSGRDGEAQTAMDRSDSGDCGDLKHANGCLGMRTAESADVAMLDDSEPEASSNSHPNKRRALALDEVDSSAGVQCKGQQTDPASRSARAASMAAEDRAKTGQAERKPLLSVDSAHCKQATGRTRQRGTKRQMTSPKDEQTMTSSSLEQRCLERLKAEEPESCQLANHQTATLSCLAAPGEQSPDEDSVLDAAAGESLSRACSTPPATLDNQGGAQIKSEGDTTADCKEEAEEAVTGRRQKIQKSVRRSALTNSSAKRGHRSSGGIQATEGRASPATDEDYMPPGDSADQSQAACKRPRLRVRGSNHASCKPEALPPIPPTASSRQPARLRWSASVGQGIPSVASPTGCRRLRSQPVDLTILRPDAFAFTPPSKRLRHHALHQGVVHLQQLHQLQSNPLLRSPSSGIRKPFPRWTSVHDQQLSQLAAEDLQGMKIRHSSDSKLMEGVEGPLTPDAHALGERLGKCLLGKAMRGFKRTEEPCASIPDQALSSCKQLFPSFMAEPLAAWDKKLESTSITMFGETASCILARQQKDAQSTWDDLLMRHAIETGAFDASSECPQSPAGAIL